MTLSTITVAITSHFPQKENCFQAITRYTCHFAPPNNLTIYDQIYRYIIVTIPFATVIIGQ